MLPAQRDKRGEDPIYQGACAMVEIKKTENAEPIIPCLCQNRTQGAAHILQGTYINRNLPVANNSSSTDSILKKNLNQNAPINRPYEPGYLYFIEHKNQNGQEHYCCKGVVDRFCLGRNWSDFTSTAL